MHGSQSERVDSLRKLVEKLPRRSSASVVKKRRMRKPRITRKDLARRSLKDSRERPRSSEPNWRRQSVRFKIQCQVQNASVRIVMRAMTTVVK
jgi:hypothetical protein